MVNTNIQAPIPLQGRGFVPRRNGNFSSGEYKHLTNVEAVVEGLRSRRSIKSVLGGAGSSAPAIDNVFGFIGDLNDFSIMVSANKQYAVNNNSRVPMWNPELIPKFNNQAGFTKLVDFFRYNGRNYWVSYRYNDDPNMSARITLHHKAILNGKDIPETYNDAWAADLVLSDAVILPNTDSYFNIFNYCNSFIQGERLWLATTTGIYFSKATDPSVFSVPDGGFFKFPDQKINYAFAYKDLIYVLCDKSIYTISYGSDPNLDAVVQKVSDNMGADHGCIYQDTPFVINQVGIYMINNTYIEKFMDNEFDVGNDIYKGRLTPFEDYMIVNKYLDVNYENLSRTGLGQARRNLVPNPSFELDTVNYLSSDLYNIRDRIADTSFTGAYTYRWRKITDTSVVAYRNACLNPSFESNIIGAVPLHSSTVLSRDTVIKKDKLASLKLAATGTSGRKIHAELTDYMSINNRFTIALEQSYSGTKSGLTFSLVSRCYDDTNTFLGTVTHTSDLRLFNQSSSTSSNFYPTNSYNNSIPLGTTKIKLVLEQTSVGDTPTDFAVYIDNIAVYMNNDRDIPDYQSVKYFDGDTLDNSYYINSWEGTPNNSASLRYGFMGLPGEPFKRAIKHTFDMPVSSNVSYTFSFKAKILNRSVLGSSSLYVWTTNPTSLESLDLSDKAVGEVFTYTKTFTTSSNTVNMSFHIDYEQTAQFAGTEIIFGDFILEKSSTYSGYFDGSITDTSTVIYAWEGVAHNSVSTYTSSSPLRAGYANGKKFTPGLEGNKLGYNVYVINMTNNSVHVLDFKDCRDINEPGYIVDIHVNPYKDYSGNYNCFLMTNRFISETSNAVNFKSHTYYLSSYFDTDFLDYAVKSNDVVDRYIPRIEVEIDSFSPDGTEFLVKKFRSLQVEGKFPVSDFNVSFGYDDSYLMNTFSLARKAVERPHAPSRVGINQRCRSLTIRFDNSNFNIPLMTDAKYGILEISYIMTYWGYTQRATEYSNSPPSIV